MKRTALFAAALLALSAAPSYADISWRHDIRAAFDEAEDRGVALFIYITRDE